jgi:hypothetical protein
MLDKKDPLTKKARKYKNMTPERMERTYTTLHRRTIRLCYI